MNTDTVAGNKLIAEFMGGIYRKTENWIFPGVTLEQYIFDYFPGEPKTEYLSKVEQGVNRLRYHCSWSWLMPVGKKIRDWLQSEIKKRPPHTCSNGDLLEVDISCAIQSYNIEMAWSAIVEFIKWYNTQNIDNGK